jgi:hypothetical protein
VGEEAVQRGEEAFAFFGERVVEESSKITSSEPGMPA